MALLLAGCSCGSSLETAGGPHPYVRPASAPAAEPRELETAAAHVRITAREVVIEPHGSPRVALVRGPAVSGEPLAPALDAIEASAPSVLVVVGDLGDDEATVAETLGAFGSLDMPTLLVLGGRDRPAWITSGLGGLEAPVRARVVDLSGVHAVRLGPLVLVPVPGAPDGRYAIADDACGLAPEDVDALAGALGAGEGEHRVLVSWAAPSSGGPASRGALGAEAGSPLVASLAERVGASGWLASFGATAGGESSGWGVALAIPPAVGAHEASDGSRPTRTPLVLDVGDSGLHVVTP